MQVLKRNKQETPQERPQARLVSIVLLILVALTNSSWPAKQAQQTSNTNLASCTTACQAESFKKFFSATQQCAKETNGNVSTNKVMQPAIQTSRNIQRAHCVPQGIDRRKRHRPIRDVSSPEPQAQVSTKTNTNAKQRKMELITPTYVDDFAIIANTTTSDDISDASNETITETKNEHGGRAPVMSGETDDEITINIQSSSPVHSQHDNAKTATGNAHAKAQTPQLDEISTDDEETNPDRDTTSPNNADAEKHLAESFHATKPNTKQLEKVGDASQHKQHTRISRVAGAAPDQHRLAEGSTCLLYTSPSPRD